MTEYITFENWLETQVLDVNAISPEAKKAFQHNYETLKHHGELPEKTAAADKGKYDLDKFKNPDGSLNIDYALQVARQSAEKHQESKQPDKEVPEDLKKLKTEDFKNKNGTIDISFALNVAAKAAAQSRGGK